MWTHPEEFWSHDSRRGSPWYLGSHSTKTISMINESSELDDNKCNIHKWLLPLSEYLDSSDSSEARVQQWWQWLQNYSWLLRRYQPWRGHRETGAGECATLSAGILLHEQINSSRMFENANLIFDRWLTGAKNLMCENFVIHRHADWYVTGTWTESRKGGSANIRQTDCVRLKFADSSSELAHFDWYSGCFESYLDSYIK